MSEIYSPSGREILSDLTRFTLSGVGMVSGRQKFIIGIVVVAIVSGCFWVIANAHPQQTAAQALILRAEEIGPGWDSGDGYADR
jgi:hypothetical protein